jgi:hypothetical protein
MPKQIIEYGTPLETLVALAKRLSAYELQYQMSSETFSDKFNKGQLDDRIDFIEWANDYEHFLDIKIEIEESLRHVA